MQSFNWPAFLRCDVSMPNLLHRPGRAELAGLSANLVRSAWLDDWSVLFADSSESIRLRNRTERNLNNARCYSINNNPRFLPPSIVFTASYRRVRSTSHG